MIVQRFAAAGLLEKKKKKTCRAKTKAQISLAIWVKGKISLNPLKTSSGRHNDIAQKGLQMVFLLKHCLGFNNAWFWHALPTQKTIASL